MNTNRKTTEKIDKKGLLSALWIFLAVNYIFCDLIGLMQPGMVNDLLTGHYGSIQITPIFLLSTAVLLEIPFTMIVLSLVLKYRLNRWVNISAGVLMAVVQIGTMSVGTPPTLFYVFFSTIVIVCNLLIVWLAWKWKPAIEPSTGS